MRKIEINGIKGNNTILIDKYKLIFGFDMNTKFYIRNYLKKYFEKDPKSEYEIENNIKSNILINDRSIDLKQYNYIEVYDIFDLKDDMKMGTKSLLLKYYDLYLEKIEYNDSFITANEVLKSLEDEIGLDIEFDDINVKSQFVDLTKKALIKMIESNVYKNDFEISPYVLSYEEIIIIQLELIKKIAKLDNMKEYIILLDMPILSKKIFDHVVHNIENLNILVFVCFLEDEIDLKLNSVAVIETEIIDLQDEEALYDISINANENITISDLKEKIIKKHVLSLKEVVGNKNN